MILIENIYYMLAYAFRALNKEGYQKIATESFENTADLCAAILIKGVSNQIKRGLGRQYIEYTKTLASPRGQIEVAESLKTRSVLKKQLVCTYDDYSENVYKNQIIKTTLIVLLKSDISKKRKKKIRNLLLYFQNIDTLNIHHIRWPQQYNRNNQTYQMLIGICYLVIEGLLQTEKNGSTKLMTFLDDQRMSHLYEKFILEYYKKEHPALKVHAAQIPWALDDDMQTGLPVMQSDITLCYQNKVLIIDAKYYAHTMQERFGARTIHSANLYQIFTYVKNKEAALSGKAHEVRGMLLYAGTDEAMQPDYCYHMSGNQISVKTLDLNQPFAQIKKTLDIIVTNYYGI